MLLLTDIARISLPSHGARAASTSRLALLAGGMMLWAIMPDMALAQQANDSRPILPIEALPQDDDVRAPTAAQTAAASTKPDAPLPASEEEIAFAADNLVYDSNSEIVTASGKVQLLREGNLLRANEVVWNRKTGEVRANGNVSITDADGNVAYGDSIEVTDALKDGAVENLLLVMAEGGRLVAKKGERRDGLYMLHQAAYSPCPVEGADGCPKEPSWQIKAVEIRYNPVTQRVRYKHARLELFGIPLFVLPGFSHSVGDSSTSGLLMPNIRLSGVNGLEISVPYYFRLSPNRDLTVTPHVFTGELPMLEANYRAYLGKGAYSVTGYITNGRYSTGASTTTASSGGRQLRGYFDASGSYQLDENWNFSGTIRRVTDRTFLRRYDINRDDRLRSTIKAERISQNSYLSIAGWSVQTLRLSDTQGQMPIALPAIDYRLRVADPLLGGQMQFQANSLAITRKDGQDTQRAFASAEWNLRTLTGLGQELTLTAYARGDVYHSSDNSLADNAAYAGQSGWQGRGIAALAADMRWPFIGTFMGGTQRITPRVQLVASPKIRNLAIPNEDARTVDLEDSNLFSLNRFPGYDRIDDTNRITYGFDYGLDLKDFSLSANIGQSYRISNRSTLFADGTGLSSRTSDIVGRTILRYKDFLSLTHRYRLDKNDFALRRNEVDATIGTRRTYASIGYLRLNRNSSSNLEDLNDREEIRLGARIAFARFWSVFGSTVIDLTDGSEDPTSFSDGYAPVRHRLGIAYQDDCIDIGVTWRRNYQTSGDAKGNNSVQLRLAFRNLGI